MQDLKLNQIRVNQICDKIHSQFYEVINKTKKNPQAMQNIEFGTKLEFVKKYNILNQTINKIQKTYQYICDKFYSNQISQHKEKWNIKELKTFVWLLIYDLGQKICSPQQIQFVVWKKYQNIFHGKSINLMKYQIKLLVDDKHLLRNWENQEEYLLSQIIKSKHNHFKWKQFSKELYFKSNKRYLRTAKQIKEHYLFKQKSLGSNDTLDNKDDDHHIILQARIHQNQFKTTKVNSVVSRKSHKLEFLKKTHKKEGVNKHYQRQMQQQQMLESKIFASQVKLFNKQQQFRQNSQLKKDSNFQKSNSSKVMDINEKQEQRLNKQENKQKKQFDIFQAQCQQWLLKFKEYNEAPPANIITTPQINLQKQQTQQK